jgi:penicillin-binding protein 1A
MTEQPPTTESDEAQEHPTPMRRRVRGCGGIFFCIMIVLSALWGGALGAFMWMLDDAKASIESVDDFRPKVGSKFYSSDGELLGEYTVEARQLVRLTDIPLKLQKAFLAIEDETFYEHRGVRPLAVLSAVRDYFRTGSLRGASTITMQIVRNIEEVTGVSTERSFRRKVKEAFVALQLDREFTKDEILELYLNQIFLGGSANGVEAAALQYFGEPCRDLTLAECATLAGLTHSPNHKRPDRYPEASQERRNTVLGRMLKYGFITQAEHDEALATAVQDTVICYEDRLKLMAAGKGLWRPNRFKAPYFVEEAKQFIRSEGFVDSKELVEGGLEVHTTVDMRLQRAAEAALLPWLDEFDEKALARLTKRGQEDFFVPVSGALVCLDNRPGYEGCVRALVGGRDFDKAKFNNATQARRQPGSSVKPFVWAAAIHNGFTPSHVEVDEPITLYTDIGTPWQPKNFSGKFAGPMTLRHALEKSVNIVSIKLVLRLGMPVVRTYLQRAGIQTEIDDSHKWTIALGSPDVTVIDLCTAYSTFAKLGVRARPTLVEEIRDRDDFRRYKSQIELKRVIPANVAYVAVHLLQGVCEPDFKKKYYPTGWKTHELGRPRGGKTGTSNESRNVWFCGFTADYTCVVWLGYRDNRPLGKGPDGRYLASHKEYTGGRLACPVWTKFMIDAHKGMPASDFEVPEGVDFYDVDRQTGLLGGDCHEAFVAGTRPPEEMIVFEDETIDDIMERVSFEDL